MNQNKLISICVPTYNGAEYLAQTLDSIVPFLNSYIDLTIVDDASTDSTLNILEKYNHRYQNVHLHKNKSNLGMDRNFLQTVKLSNSKYIWFCGQDDIIGEKAISEVTKVLQSNDLIALNCNFSQFNHDYTECNFESFFKIATFNNYKAMSTRDLLLFDSPEEYFSIFKQPPSFLPSVIMKRCLFRGVNLRQYNGTHFVQVGVFLELMHTGKVGALTTPLVKGRVPNNGWQYDGAKLLKIMTGDIRAKKIAFNNNSYLPRKIIRRDLFKFAIHYPFLLANAYKYGLKGEEVDFNGIESIYYDKWFYYLLIKFSHAISPKALIFLTGIIRPIKKFLLTLH